MDRYHPLPSRQRGAYLLEALVGILIFSLGVLGVVGLQAASLRTTTTSSLRAEAIFAANKLLGQMWADDPANLVANYASTVGGPGYVEFKTDLHNVQQGAWYLDPTVLITPGPSTASSNVQITIFWQGPDGTISDRHQYTTAGVVGENCWTGLAC